MNIAILVICACVVSFSVMVLAATAFIMTWQDYKEWKNRK